MQTLVSAGDIHHRLTTALLQLIALREDDFPEGLRPRFRKMRDLLKPAVANIDRVRGLTEEQAENAARAILDLFEATIRAATEADRQNGSEH